MALEAIVCIHLAMTVASGYGEYSLVGVHLTMTVAGGYGALVVGARLNVTVNTIVATELGLIP